MRSHDLLICSVFSSNHSFFSISFFCCIYSSVCSLNSGTSLKKVVVISLPSGFCALLAVYVTSYSLFLESTFTLELFLVSLLIWYDCSAPPCTLLDISVESLMMIGVSLLFFSYSFMFLLSFPGQSSHSCSQEFFYYYLFLISFLSLLPIYSFQIWVLHLPLRSYFFLLNCFAAHWFIPLIIPYKTLQILVVLVLYCMTKEVSDLENSS